MSYLMHGKISIPLKAFLEWSSRYSPAPKESFSKLSRPVINGDMLELDVTFSDTELEEVPQENLGLADPDLLTDTALQYRIEGLFVYHKFSPIHAMGKVRDVLSEFHTSGKYANVLYLGETTPITVHKAGEASYQFKPYLSPTSIADLCDPEEAGLEYRVQRLFNYHLFNPFHAVREINTMLNKLYNSTKSFDVKHEGKDIKITVHKAGHCTYRFFRLRASPSSIKEGE